MNNLSKNDTINQDQPLVSVVVPCLNRAHFLVPTIESILQQDYPSLECIVVDGGSTDGTLEILERYGDKIKWVSEPDCGQADAINKGWKMSRGEVLAWLNADDIWTVPDAVGQAIAYMLARPSVDVVYGDCGKIDADGNIIGMSYLHEWDLEYAVEHSDHCIPQPAAFIRRRAVEKVGWLDSTLLFMDWDLWYRIGLVGTIEHLPVLLAHARKTPSYWHSRGQVAAENCVQVTRKFFSLPNVPSNIRLRKRRALSNAYLRGTDYALVAGRDWKTIFGYTLRAMLADPTNALNALRRLQKCLAAGAAEDQEVPVWLLDLKRASRAFRRIKRSTRRQPRSRVPNLHGDRQVEWAWIASQMPSGPGEALEFGSGKSHLSLIAAQRGFQVTAVDLEGIQWSHVHPGLHFIRGDILKLPVPTGHFDLVINCSAVEHVGLAGRYGVKEDQFDGDLAAMARLAELMRPGTVMLLTIPVGQDAVFAPFCRVYGVQRLPRLLENYVVEKEIFWVKDDQNRWILADKVTALNFVASANTGDALQDVYALGCFVLRKGHPQQDEGCA